MDARLARTAATRTGTGSPGAAFRTALFAAALALVAWPTATAAQEIDARWLPWLGCWEPVDGAVASDRAREAGAAEGRELVCARPADDGASIELVSVSKDGITGSERIRADGREVRLEAEGCEEFRSARFSEDGARVFTRTRYVCEGGIERTTSGVMAFLSPDEWLEVSVVEAEGGSLPWVRRYRAASPAAAAEVGFEAVPAERARAVRMARSVAAAGLTLDEVIGATAEVHPDAIRTWLAERGQRFRVDADALVRMEDAGVPDEVIDVVVAVSFPQRFALDRGEPRRGYGRRGARRVPTAAPYGHRWYRSGVPPWYYYDYYFTPFGRRHRFGAVGGFGPTRVIVIDRAGDSGGRVVSGRGYTRGSSGSGSSGAPSGSRVNRGSGSGSSGDAASGTRAPDRSSESGRRAKPREGGGGS